MKIATKLDLAEAQLLGWHSCKHGESLISLVSSMGLTKSEWEKIKVEYPTTLNESEKIEIDEYFKKSNANPDCPGGCKDVYPRKGGTFKCKDCGKIFY